MPNRISRNYLKEISTAVSERDKKILSSVRTCRYLTTKQIQRLHFTDSANPTAGLRCANRTLGKLKSLELTGTLERRIGGVRAGSGALIWYLTDAGERMLRLGAKEPAVRKRFFEPSPFFLSHTLAVSECYVQLSELCCGHTLKLVSAELEPECWRTYSHRGKPYNLRPDMFLITHCDNYEDRWFIEIDLSTEAPTAIREKCHRYHEYYRSGTEQKQHDMFPLVVWVVPSEARKNSLTEHIRDEFKHSPKIFAVITPDELCALVRQGVDRSVLC